MLSAWWWFTVGATMSAAIAPGIVGAFALGYGAIAGAIVGAVTGLPAGVAIVSWVRSNESLSTDPRVLTLALEWIGAIGALAGCGVFVWSWAVPVAIGDGTSVRPFVVRTIAVVTGVALSGRWVGRRLAKHYLRSRHVPAPRSCFALRADDRRDAP